jgi:hypothetical protein
MIIYLIVLSTGLILLRMAFANLIPQKTNMITYLNSIMPSVSTQGQTDSAYFHISNAFDINNRHG